MHDMGRLVTFSTRETLGGIGIPPGHIEELQALHPMAENALVMFDELCTHDGTSWEAELTGLRLVTPAHPALWIAARLMAAAAGTEPPELYTGLSSVDLFMLGCRSARPAEAWALALAADTQLPTGMMFTMYPADVLGELADCELARVRHNVAIAGRMPRSKLLALGRDPDPDVRWAVASRPTIPAGLLAEFVADPDERVRAKAAADRRLTEEQVAVLRADPSRAVQDALEWRERRLLERARKQTRRRAA